MGIRYVVRGASRDGLFHISRSEGGLLKGVFLRAFPHAFVVIAHLAGLSIAIWMERYDLIIASIAFGIPSTLLFFDLLPGGGNRIVKMIGRIVR